MQTHTHTYLILIREVLDFTKRMIMVLLVERSEECEITPVPLSLVAHMIGHSVNSDTAVCHAIEMTEFALYTHPIL